MRSFSLFMHNTVNAELMMEVVSSLASSPSLLRDAHAQYKSTRMRGSHFKNRALSHSHFSHTTSVHDITVDQSLPLYWSWRCRERGTEATVASRHTTLRRDSRIDRGSTIAVIAASEIPVLVHTVSTASQSH